MAYNGDGVTKSYAVPFGYLNRTDIYVTVDGESTEYTWLSQGNIELSTAPESGSLIKIYRDTPIDEPIVDYTDGSILPEEDLDLPIVQNMYVAQEIKDNANDAVETANAATETADIALDTSDTAMGTANTALSTSNEALTKASTAEGTANEALEAIGPTVVQEVKKQNIPKQVSDNVDDKLEALDLDTRIYEEVVSAISGVTIPGLSKETITGALGYTPYDAETNSKDFATNAEVAGAIAAIPNADWNATDGAACIKNKPVLSAVATSGNYADLQNKPAAMTGATAEAAGTSGFVPVPAAGDEDKVLKGDGTWGEVDLGGIVTELNGKADKDLSNISENIAYIVDSYHDDEGNWYRKWSDGWVEQGGLIKKGGNNYIGQIQITFLCPLSKIVTLNRTNVSAYSSTVITNNFWYSFESISNTGFTFSIDATNADSYWYVAGIGAE